MAQARHEEIKAWLLWKMDASQQELGEGSHVRIESGDRLLGNGLMSWKINWEKKIKQQIDPAFGATKTDVQFPGSEEAVSKTSISNPHASGFWPDQNVFCNHIWWWGRLGALCCTCTPAAHRDFRTCHGAGLVALWWHFMVEGQNWALKWQQLPENSVLCKTMFGCPYLTSLEQIGSCSVFWHVFKGKKCFHHWFPSLSAKINRIHKWCFQNQTIKMLCMMYIGTESVCNRFTVCTFETKAKWALHHQGNLWLAHRSFSLSEYWYWYILMCQPVLKLVGKKNLL